MVGPLPSGLTVRKFGDKPKPSNRAQPGNLFLKMSRQPDVAVVLKTVCEVLFLDEESSIADLYLDLRNPHRWRQFSDWKRLEMLGDWLRAEAYELMDLVEGPDVDTIGD